MWIFVAEAIGALGLLLFIVWWTLGPTHRREQEMLRLAREEAEQRTTRSAEAAKPPTADPVR
jgi:hypothetical protein